MDNIEDKISNLDKRILEVSKQITELEQTKINLMMLKRNLGMDQVKKNLEDSFTDEIQDKLRKLSND